MSNNIQTLIELRIPASMIFSNRIGLFLRRKSLFQQPLDLNKLLRWKIRRLWKIRR